MEEYQVYQDIKARTNGEIYIGVVGPVRTGKSTFIKRFMNQMVIPNISGENDRQLAQDELPQSASGKTIMTTEPKFIPKEAVSINVTDNLDMKVKMIDCVGYVVKDAEGQFEDGKERMVRTPWFDYDIPFSKAAEIGTNKVINNHSTVGIVVTTDGSFGELPRESYLEAEQKTVDELKAIGKPFVILLNTDKPSSSQTAALSAEMSDTYGASVIPVNVEQLRESDITYIFTELLMSFPVTSIYFEIPKWLEVVDDDNEIKSSVICDAAQIMAAADSLRDIDHMDYPENEYVKRYKCSSINMADGCDVVYFILWVIPAIRIPASSAIFTGLGLMTMTALSFVEVEDDTFDRVTGDEKWFKIAFLVGAALTLVGIILLLMFFKF